MAVHAVSLAGLSERAIHAVRRRASREFETTAGELYAHTHPAPPGCRAHRFDVISAPSADDTATSQRISVFVARYLFGEHRFACSYARALTRSEVGGKVPPQFKRRVRMRVMCAMRSTTRSVLERRHFRHTFMASVHAARKLAANHLRLSYADDILRDKLLADGLATSCGAGWIYDKRWRE